MPIAYRHEVQSWNVVPSINHCRIFLCTLAALYVTRWLSGCDFKSRIDAACQADQVQSRAFPIEEATLPFPASRGVEQPEDHIRSLLNLKARHQ